MAMGRAATPLSGENGRPKKGSLGISAYKVIRRRILDGDLQPGDMLIEATLAEELGMSRTPIRDALSKLQYEGLVTSVPNKGTVVEHLGPMDLVEMYDVREFMEGLAAHLLARRITRGQAEILEELACKADDPAGTLEDEIAFHSAIVDMCGNSRVRQIVRQFCLRAASYDELVGRAARRGSTTVGRHGERIAAHRALAQSITSGSPEEAESGARAHVRRAKADMASFVLAIESGA